MKLKIPHPKAEIVITPRFAIVPDCFGCGGVAQVMVPTDKDQWDGGIGPSQGCLQVTLLPLSKLVACTEKKQIRQLFAGFTLEVPTNDQRRELFFQFH